MNGRKRASTAPKTDKPPASVKITRKRLQDDRLAELLDIAAEVFIAQGFAAASTNEIVRRANDSKTTFYSRFPSKEDLFLAVIERRMTSVFGQVAAFAQGQTLQETLQQFCTSLLRIALSPEQISLIRMIGMESGRYPALATRFYENGPKRGEHALANYLSSQIAQGSLRREDPLVMARQLMNLITGSPVRWFVLGFDPHPISKRALQKHVTETVCLFLRIYGSHQP